MGKRKFYAVASGRKVGVFPTWEECKQQTHGYKGAKFKSFATKEEAEAFAKGGGKLVKRPKSEETASAERPAKRRRVTEPDGVSFEISFDGGSRGNPGLAGCGVEIITRIPEANSKEITRTVVQQRRYLSKNSTNNQAEYIGLICGLEFVHDTLESQDGSHLHSRVNLVVRGDSKLIIQQMKGKWAVTTLTSLHRRATELMKSIKKLVGSLETDFEHVVRKFNKVADKLANEAMDAKKSWMVRKDSNGDETQETLADIDPSIYSV